MNPNITNHQATSAAEAGPKTSPTSSSHRQDDRMLLNVSGALPRVPEAQTARPGTEPEIVNVSASSLESRVRAAHENDLAFTARGIQRSVLGLTASLGGVGICGKAVATMGATGGIDLIGTLALGGAVVSLVAAGSVGYRALQWVERRIMLHRSDPQTVSSFEYEKGVAELNTPGTGSKGFYTLLRALSSNRAGGATQPDVPPFALDAKIAEAALQYVTNLSSPQRKHEYATMLLKSIPPGLYGSEVLQAIAQVLSANGMGEDQRSKVA